MASADHLAAEGEQRHGAEPVAVGAEQGGDQHVAPGAQPAVGLDGDGVAQPVGHQVLVRLGEPQLPRRPGVLDRDQRRGPGAAAVAGDGDHVGQGLGHPDGDGAHPRARDQLHRHPGERMEHLEVVDQLGEVLDGVDVVMGRRRDQGDPRLGVAQPGDLDGDLVPGELTALARLRALGDLDLQLLGRGEVAGGDPEPAAGHLLDRRAPRGAEADWVLTALTRVGQPTEVVHRLGQGLVRLGGQGTERHGGGGEASHDDVDRLDRVGGDRRAERADHQQVAQLQWWPIELDQPLELLPLRRIVVAHRLLQRQHGHRPVDVRGPAAGDACSNRPAPPHRRRRRRGASWRRRRAGRSRRRPPAATRSGSRGRTPRRRGRSPRTARSPGTRRWCRCPSST